MQIANNWKDFELLDSGDGEKLEKWGDFLLRRPDPQAIWPKTLGEREWEKADAFYRRSSSGGGAWEFKRELPERWVVKYKNLSFYVRTMGFKHTGIFPEQSVNWDWMMEKISKVAGKQPVNVLNLFSYTGAATVACAAAGAEVCHVDAAKNMVHLASENLKLNKLDAKPVRWIIDDAVKFVRREITRGKKYDGIIMDPPSFGRGPKGEIWKFEEKIFDLIKTCTDVLSDKPLFFLINSYTTGFPPMALENILKSTVAKKFGGKVSADHLGLKATKSDLILPCGIMGRWEA
ncbi:MAG: class I SAM-dependent methyltransferase [Patescibacteria group bacterium]